MVSAIKEAITRAVSRMTATESRSAWTECLMAAMSRLGDESGFDVRYTGSSANMSEWLYDMSWLKFRPLDGVDYLCGVELAMESEWDLSLEAVLADFNKLLQSQATYKVLVCRRVDGGVLSVLQNAIRNFPSVGKCTYVVALCDQDNANGSNVVFHVLDENGRSARQIVNDVVRRYFETVAKTTQASFRLNFEGFWPDKKSGFQNGKRGLYFVFAGVRKPSEGGYVAELHRVIFIGTSDETDTAAVSTFDGKPGFSAACDAGEIPYFAFAEIAERELALCCAAVTYKYKPRMNMEKGAPAKPTGAIRITMTGDVASCLGEHNFVV